MTSYGFGLSDIINVTSIFNGNNTNSTSTEHTGKLETNN